jgi:hypothetical protein
MAEGELISHCFVNPGGWVYLLASRESIVVRSNPAGAVPSEPAIASYRSLGNRSLRSERNPSTQDRAVPQSTGSRGLPDQTDGELLLLVQWSLVAPGMLIPTLA